MLRASAVLIDPPHYGGSEDYQPGLMNQVGMQVLAILVIVLIFILIVLGSRLLLRRSRRLGPRTRKILKIFGGLTRPAAPRSRSHGRHARTEARRTSDTQYRMKPAFAGDGDRTVALEAAVPQKVEQAPLPRRVTRDLPPTPEEAWPFYAEDEVAAVVAVLNSGKVNQWTGSRVFEFEKAYTRHLGSGRAIALANGSVALELALRAFGIGPGDEVIVTPRTFVASAFCAQLVGATPVFAEVDEASGNITAETIAAVLTPRTKAVIPVHIGGWPADMPAIMALAREKGLFVIEDCAQAHGAEIDGRPVGTFGDAGTFSFCQDKIITTGGEGGLITFRDEAAFEWAWSFKDHGKNRARALEPSSRPGFRWLHDQVGTNWRMTEISAAIGLAQLDKLAQWRLRRARNAEVWADALDPIPGMRVPRPPANLTAAFYKFYAYVDVDPVRNEALRDRMLERLNVAGIRAFSGSCSEVYREAAFANLPVEPLPVARALGQSSLMFEVHPTLDSRRLRDRADAAAEIIRRVLASEGD